MQDKSLVRAGVPPALRTFTIHAGSLYIVWGQNQIAESLDYKLISCNNSFLEIAF